MSSCSCSGLPGWVAEVARCPRERSQRRLSDLCIPNQPAEALKRAVEGARRPARCLPAGLSSRSGDPESRPARPTIAKFLAVGWLILFRPSCAWLEASCSRAFRRRMRAIAFVWAISLGFCLISMRKRWVSVLQDSGMLCTGIALISLAMRSPIAVPEGER